MASTSRTPLDTKALTKWNLALKHVADSQRRQRDAVGAPDQAGSLNMALHRPREPNAIGGEHLASNLADIMRPESTVLQEYGLQSDFQFAAASEQRQNTVMQLCAWDDSIPGSAVSGCLNLRSTFNVNKDLECAEFVTPLSIYALNRDRFETLRAAVAEQPTLHAAMEGVCDVFRETESVRFQTLQAPRDEFINVSADPRRTQFVNVHTSRYSAARAHNARLASRDLEIERVEINFHENVKSRQFIAESLRVTDKLSGATGRQGRPRGAPAEAGGSRAARAVHRPSHDAGPRQCPRPGHDSIPQCSPHPWWDSPFPQ